MPDEKARSQRGRDIVKDVYGSSLQGQGRGFYVSMEFLAILRGSLLLEVEEGGDSRVLPDPEAAAVFMRPTHDFARRIMGGRFEDGEDSEHLSDESLAALKDLLLGLQLPVPGRKGEPGDWRKRHLYPFPPDFIHYDALERRNKIKIEGDSYRGGGGLAHRIIRTDPDIERLETTRAGVRRLLGDSKSPLGALARALPESREPWQDKTESLAQAIPSPWLEELRDGVCRIVHRDGLPASKRIDALMVWVPYCIFRHQQSLALARMENSDALLVVSIIDCLPNNSPLRDRARQDFNSSWNSVKQALKGEARAQGDHELADGPSAWMDSPKAFFAATAYAVGACNAPSGIRWFTTTPRLVEAIVLAKVDSPMTFDRFCHDLLYGKLGMVIDGRSAQSEGIIDIDQSTFDANAESLSEVLSELGVLERYSDTTRMVGFSA